MINKILVIHTIIAETGGFKGCSCVPALKEYSMDVAYKIKKIIHDFNISPCETNIDVDTTKECIEIKIKTDHIIPDQDIACITDKVVESEKESYNHYKEQIDIETLMSVQEEVTNELRSYLGI